MFISKIVRFPIRKCSRLFSDRLYLELLYPLYLGKKLNLINPRTYNEKLQWLKLYDRKSEYTRMVDKAEAKKYVAGIIGEQHIIKTLGVWDRFEDIDFDALPDQFVLKCTHDSGGLIICKDKSRLDLKMARKKLNKCLKHNYYWEWREYPYKNVKPRILAEQYMVDESGYELKDYKFFCFNGKVKMMFVAKDRETNTHFDFYSEDFQHLPFTQGHPHAECPTVKPHGFEEMVGLAEKLSVNIPHVRVDFYDINGHIYFGELTLYHYAGLVPFEPASWDYRIGEWLQLPE